MCDILMVGVCNDDYVRNIKSKFKFDVLFSGDDWKGTEKYKKTESDFKKKNISIEYLPHTQEISTTMIKEKLKNNK